MFFLLPLERNLTVAPAYLGPKLQTTLASKLLKSVEGTCSGRYGFIICVTQIEEIGKGKVMDGTGDVMFPVRYSAVVFRPFKGEVMDAVVTQVNAMGIFAEAGPLQVFVSTQLIPSDTKYDDQSSPPAYVSEDLSVRIQKDSTIRLKIVGTRVDATEIFVIGSIKEDYLGQIED
eukprot:GILJ01005301.1.p1 GENE.GILJ01005301.1~~GILJ01005301.1.p1  ORF type:complete len:174 (-),score=23.48 GILJ01005301.1:253-774(-)